MNKKKEFKSEDGSVVISEEKIRLEKQIIYLLHLSEGLLKTNVPLAQQLLIKAKRVSLVANLPFPARFSTLFCNHCYAPLVSQAANSFKLQSKKRRRAGNQLVRVCECCGHKQTIIGNNSEKKEEAASTKEETQKRKKPETGKSKFNLKRQAKQLLVESQSAKPIQKQSNSSWEIYRVCVILVIVQS